MPRELVLLSEKYVDQMVIYILTDVLNFTIIEKTFTSSNLPNAICPSMPHLRWTIEPLTLNI